MEDSPAIKMNELMIHVTNMHVAQKHYVRRKKPDTKDYIFYDSI